MVQALNTNFNAATLTGACIEDWHINSYTNLQGVICEFIFKGYGSERQKFTDRRPHDPNTFFKPDEFAALMQKSLETVDLIFIDGIDWKAFFASFQQLRSKYRDDHLSIQAIEKKTDGAFVIRLEVNAQADRAAIEQDGKRFYETQLKVLEAQYQECLQLQGAHLADIQKYLEHERQNNTNLMRLVESMEKKQGPTYNISGNKFGGGLAADGSTQIGGTLNDYSVTIGSNLDEIIGLITALREQAQEFPVLPSAR